MRLGILGTWFCLLSFGCLLASPSNLNRFFAEPGDFSKYDSTLDKELDRAENNGRIKKHWGQSVSSGLALECPHYGEVSAADNVKIGRDCLACGQKCCSRNADKRLYYGRDSYTNEFPWFVAVFVDGRFECGGVMVSPNSAVTAAHCVHKFCPRSNLRYSRRITVKVGSLNLNLDERTGPGSSHHIVEQVICNHYYRSGSNYRNDAAILRLEDHQRFPFVCLNNFTSEHPITRNCLAVGHGFTHKSNNITSIQQVARISLLGYERCLTEFQMTGVLNKWEICGRVMKDGVSRLVGCFFDSGGPVVCPKDPDDKCSPYVLHGIFSRKLRGTSCARSELNILTDVSRASFTSVIDWIKQHTAFERRCP